MENPESWKSDLESWDSHENSTRKSAQNLGISMSFKFVEHFTQYVVMKDAAKTNQWQRDFGDFLDCNAQSNWLASVLLGSP